MLIEKSWRPFVAGWPRAENEPKIILSFLLDKLFGARLLEDVQLPLTRFLAAPTGRPFCKKCGGGSRFVRPAEIWLKGRLRSIGVFRCQNCQNVFSDPPTTEAGS